MSANLTGFAVAGAPLEARVPQGVAPDGPVCVARSTPSDAAVWASLLTAATVVIAPYLIRGYTVGHDTGIHMSWWLEMARLFREGVLHPRWAPWAYYGYGEPAFLFYPPLSLYIGGLLTLLLPFRLALGVYVWVVAVLAGFSFFHLCRHFFDRRAALLGALVYVLNPYHLLEIHARCSLAELLVSVWFPLLLLAICRFNEPGTRRIAIAAACFAAIVLTNVPLTVISGYGALAFALALMLARKSGIQSMVKFALAIALGAGVAAFFLVPAWAEKPWVVASVHAVVPPAAQMVPLGMPHGHFGWALAVVEFGQIILGCIAWMFCRRMKSRDAFWAFSALFLLSVLMVLPLSAALWRSAPALVYVQFPWRWLGPMGLALSFFIAAIVQQFRNGFLFAASVCMLGLVTVAAFTVMIDLKADSLLASLQNSISAGRGYLAWAYVLPRDVKIDQFGVPYYLTPGEALILAVGAEEATGAISSGDVAAPSSGANAPRIAITRWSSEARDFVVDTPEPAWIRVRLFWFPGWIAHVNGKKLDAVTTNARGALLLHLPSGQNHVQLVYRGTRDQKVGIVISFACLILFVGMLRKQREAGVSSIVSELT